MNKNINKIALCIMCIAMAGCASSSKDIRAAYVSPLQYNKYNCDQMSMEAQRVSAKAAELAGVQDANASSDAVAAGVGVVIFWPTLFLMKGDGQTAAELARLKGEFDAIEVAAIEKNCSLRFRQPERQASLRK